MCGFSNYILIRLIEIIPCGGNCYHSLMTILQGYVMQSCVNKIVFYCANITLLCFDTVILGLASWSVALCFVMTQFTAFGSSL